MAKIISIFSCLIFMLVGVVSLQSIKSDIQIIIALVGFGFGIMFALMATVVGRR